jgi:cytochrome c2
MHRLRLLPAGLLLLGVAACKPDAAATAERALGGNARHGRALIASLGCGACHTIPGVAKARGKVGPPLTSIGERTFIAGMLPNTPKNMLTWLEAPQSVIPGNAMPNMELTDHDARDVAAYLYTLR